MFDAVTTSIGGLISREVADWVKTHTDVIEDRHYELCLSMSEYQRKDSEISDEPIGTLQDIGHFVQFTSSPIRTDEFDCFITQAVMIVRSKELCELFAHHLHEYPKQPRVSVNQLKDFSNLARSIHKQTLAQLKSVLKTTKVPAWVEIVNAQTEQENKVA